MAALEYSLCYIYILRLIQFVPAVNSMHFSSFGDFFLPRIMHGNSLVGVWSLEIADLDNVTLMPATGPRVIKGPLKFKPALKLKWDRQAAEMAAKTEERWEMLMKRRREKDNAAGFRNKREGREKKRDQNKKESASKSMRNTKYWVKNSQYKKYLKSQRR
eukprot:gnl/MRDRNA2_/MRDRNA2_101302_c0_seq1.p1 gnl/MRDRNA2_/MRDRNA2_101302_c0~~gnl/MRDRNA2_/MRDRNA2_101302_c0_seq1.p1  ORF type:complete len:160 (-),score=33.43 gnl/MRDRNA2_/MRDRNA2_101302_c0_seq1:86-565(-)